MRTIGHFLNGANVAGTSGRFGDIYNPATGEVQARVPFATRAEMRKAVENAQKAFLEWSAVNPQRRARVMFDFKALVEKNMDELALMLSSEHGKVIADSRGDIQRGLEVIEFACGIPHLLKGEYTEGAGPGIDIYSMRQPLGVVAGITPFNFPAMIPMWMFGVAIACGNTFICKPSEKDPSRAAAPGRADDGSGRAGRRAQRRQRRQGSGRRHPRRSRHPGGELRRLVGHRRIMSTPAARRTESACRPWAGPRTTPSSCPTPTSTR